MKKLFPASVVGSLPRPRFVRELLEAEGGISPADYQKQMDAAVSFAVAMQENAGLDVVTDGEWRRRSYIGVISELAHGFELGVNPVDGRPWTIARNRLSPKAGGFIAREAEFLRGVTTRQVKVAMPAPALLGERLWDTRASSAAYPKREDFVRDCVPILRAELERVAATGADIVQIDDPHLCLFVDPEVRAAHADWRSAADFAADMVNAVVEGIRGPTIALHLCRRAGARARGEHDFRGGYEDIVPFINKLKVGHLTIEFSTPGSGSLATLGLLREDFEIGLGCVGVTPGEVDPVETVVARVEGALKHIDRSRIVLNPDCGFAPGSAARVDLDEVYEKLRIEVAAAALLRARH